MYQEPGHFPTLYLKLVSSHRAATPGDCIRLHVDGLDSGSMVRGSTLQLEHVVDQGWERVHLLLAGRSPDAAPRWESYSSGTFGMTLPGYRGTTPSYVRLPPVGPGDYRFRLDLVHRNHDLGGVRARTATLYSPLRVLSPNGQDG